MNWIDHRRQVNTNTCSFCGHELINKPPRREEKNGVTRARWKHIKNGRVSATSYPDAQYEKVCVSCVDDGWSKTAQRNMCELTKVNQSWFTWLVTFFFQPLPSCADMSAPVSKAAAVCEGIEPKQQDEVDCTAMWNGAKLVCLHLSHRYYHTTFDWTYSLVLLFAPWMVWIYTGWRWISGGWSGCLIRIIQRGSINRIMGIVVVYDTLPHMSPINSMLIRHEGQGVSPCLERSFSRCPTLNSCWCRCDRDHVQRMQLLHSCCLQWRNPAPQNVCVSRSV